MLLRNVDTFLPGYTWSHARIRYYFGHSVYWMYKNHCWQFLCTKMGVLNTPSTTVHIHI